MSLRCEECWCLLYPQEEFLLVGLLESVQLTHPMEARLDHVDQTQVPMLQVEECCWMLAMKMVDHYMQEDWADRAD
jgi:hypothetical protein